MFLSWLNYLTCAPKFLNSDPLTLQKYKKRPWFSLNLSLKPRRPPITAFYMYVNCQTLPAGGTQRLLGPVDYYMRWFWPSVTVWIINLSMVKCQLIDIRSSTSYSLLPRSGGSRGTLARRRKIKSHPINYQFTSITICDAMPCRMKRCCVAGLSISIDPVTEIYAAMHACTDPRGTPNQRPGTPLTLLINHTPIVIRNGRIGSFQCAAAAGWCQI